MLAALSARAAVVSVDSFNHAEPAAVWRPVGGAPAPVRAGAGGLVFACPFDRDIDRVCWDREVKLDLSTHTSFALELTCDQPAALRALGIYLRSGNGWYVWLKPLTEAGRQTLILRKGDFATEGSPAGWDRIDRLRLSPWRGTPAATRLTLSDWTARKDSVVVVRATTSAPNPAERAYAGRICDRVSRLLEARGVSHTVVTDDDAAAIAGASLAILPDNPAPPAAELAALRRCLERGGKLMVFYGQSEALARLMGVRMGEYTFSEDFTRWRSYAFTDPQQWRVPGEVFQKSQSLRPVWPGEGGEVIAWWRNSAGRTQREPAWVATARGVWMSHVLLDDDLEAKGRMLVGLAGRLDPAVLPEAARHALAGAGKVDGYPDFARAAAALAGAGAGTQADAIRSHVAAARAHHARMLALYGKGDHPGVLDAAAVVDGQIAAAYALAQSPRPGEFRGVWDHDGTGWWPGNWDATCRELSRRGITAVFPNLMWGGNAHYPGKVLPQSATFRMYGDQAAQVTKAAQAHGLEAHLWVVCFNLGNAPATFVRQLQKEGRTQTGADGKATTWLNPAHPKNQEMLLQAVAEAVRAYPFAGVHLDYVRYPGADYDYSPATRQLFEAALGTKVARWPQDVRPGGPRRDRFVAWRAAQITAFVKRARDTVKAIDPKLKLSAAVWGGWPDTIKSIGQDWAAWVKNGHVDFVCPMNYSDSLYKFTALVQKQNALPGAAGRIYPGIGVTADESQLPADQVIEQIVNARRLGSSGFMLFDLSHTLQHDTLPALSQGVTAR